MSGFYKKAVVWLGLNEEYPDGGDVEENGIAPEDSSNGEVYALGDDEAGHDLAPGPAPHGRATAGGTVGHDDYDSSPLTPKPLSSDRQSSTVRPVPMDEREDAHGHQSDGGSGTVRAVPLAKSVVPQTVVPQSYNDAQAVADVFKDGKPVVIDLVSAERDLSRRLIDFSAGLCYGLGGSMEKLSSDIYLLSPDGVEVSSEDKERLSS